MKNTLNILASQDNEKAKNSGLKEPRSKHTDRFGPENSGNGRNMEARIRCPDPVTGFVRFRKEPVQNEAYPAAGYGHRIPASKSDHFPDSLTLVRYHFR
jgi:hypothetical protein